MTTTDIWFAAFIRKHFPAKVPKTTRKNNKIEFIFDLNAEEWHALKVEFINSEESAIKYRIEKLKDLAYQ